KMMLKIILYAYTQSVFSGRRIEKSLHDSIRMMSSQPRSSTGTAPSGVSPLILRINM
ncbi:transposase, partial [Staphylococcus aureus]|nr:transposase [Staphylococcus aureus]